MRHASFVTGLVLSTPLFVACAQHNAKAPSTSASAQGSAAQAQQASRTGVTEAQGQATGAAGQPRKVVVVTVGLLFPPNGVDLAPEAKPKLDEVATALNVSPEANEVMVEGYTDDTGDARFNKALSKGRAQAVADYLVSRGVPMNRITTKGLGSDNPVSPEKTVEGRAMNRRVEIVIQPASGQPGAP